MIQQSMKTRTGKVLFRGYTLIEMVAVIAIVGIVTGTIIVSFSRSQSQRKLDAASREFAAVLREAQNNALSGKLVNDTNLPCSFYVKWTEGESHYLLRYIYHTSGNSCTSSPGDELITTYTLRGGVVFSASSQISFSVPLGGVTGAGDVRMSASNGSGPSIYTCVSAGGRILDNQSTVNSCAN